MSAQILTRLRNRPVSRADDSLFVGTSTPATAGGPIRELDRRRSDGIDVRLLWRPADDRVAVAVFDSKTGEAFEIQAERHEALNAFHHPYSYAACDGGDHKQQVAL